MSEQATVEVFTQIDKDADLPLYASTGASGADVRACIDTEMVIPPRKSALVPTGLRFAIPDGFEIQVRPRSGLAVKHQITVLNSPGTIDSDYRGELFIIMINHGEEPFVVTPHMRIAQVVVASVVRAEFTPSESLAATSRGEGRFGHTGTH